jgi:nucleoside phosphorylase
MLLVAATEPELCGHDGLVCGVGPVEAAARTARALAASRPEAVLHVGLAGARRDSGLAVGSLVVGERSVYEDLRTTLPLSPRELAGAPELVAAASSLLGVEPTAIGTSGRVGGAGGCGVEAMEGFAVLRACALAGVPAVEVRVVSNLVEDERAAWRIDDALAALAQVLPGLVAAIGAAVRESP